MNLFHLSGSSFITALGWTLLDSLWQALTILVCQQILLALTRQAAARVKYYISSTALLGILTWFTVTLFRQIHLQHEIFPGLHTTTLSAGWTELSGNGSLSSSVIPAAGHSLLQQLQNSFPLLTLLYFAGMVFCALRLTRAYLQMRAFRTKGLVPVAQIWEDQLNRLKACMEITRPVKLLASLKVDVPMMAGWIKPVILLPLAMVNNLRPDQIEAILMHELAHIKRHDYLVNLLQNLADTLLFFNPFAWAVSRSIRKERENCCDDMVVAAVNPLQYARALVALEENRLGIPRLVMASVSGKQQLFQRIKRIMEMKRSNLNPIQKLLTALVITAALASMAWLSPSAGRNTNRPASTNKRLTSGTVALPVEIFPLDILHQLAADTDIKKIHRKMVFVDNNGQVTQYDDTSELSEEQRSEIDDINSKLNGLNGLNDSNGLMIVDKREPMDMPNLRMEGLDSQVRVMDMSGIGRDDSLGMRVMDMSGIGRDDSLGMLDREQREIMRLQADRMNLEMRLGMHKWDSAYRNQDWPKINRQIQMSVHKWDSAYHKTDWKKYNMQMKMAMKDLDSSFRHMDRFKFKREMFKMDSMRKMSLFKMDSFQKMNMGNLKMQLFLADSIGRIAWRISDSIRIKQWPEIRKQIRISMDSAMHYRYNLKYSDSSANVVVDMIKHRNRYSYFTGPKGRVNTDELVDNLRQDHLITNPDKYSIELDANGLTVDGKKQPKEIYEKYRDLVGSKTTLSIHHDQNHDSININTPTTDPIRIQ